MRKSILTPLACHTRAHCRACRTDPDWLESVVGVRKFDCPHGITALTLESRGLGDTIAKVTTAVGIKPCGGCKKRQKKLNDMFSYKKAAGRQDEVAPPRE